MRDAGCGGTLTNRALEFAKAPLNTITGIKSLMNYSMGDLERYLAYENEVIIGIFGKMKTD